MLNERNIGKLNFISAISLILIFAISILIFIIKDEYERFELESTKLEFETLEKRKRFIKTEVDRAIKLIDNRRSMLKSKIKSELKQELLDIESLTLAIYRKYEKSKSKEEIFELISLIIGKKRFKKRGSFFIYEDSLDRVDKFIEDSRTISYLKFIDKLGIYIGAKNYIDDVKEEIQNEIKRELINYRYEKDGYIFVLELLDIKGGDRFAIEIVNPDIKQIGKYLSDSREDAKGFKYRQKYLKDLRERGESFTIYYYQKPNSTKEYPKISYIKLYKEWDWILGIGQYLDDVNIKIAKEKESLREKITYKILMILSIFFVVIIFATLFAIKFSEKIQNIVDRYKASILSKNRELERLNSNLELIVDRKTKDLQELNSNLEARVKSEVSKNLKQEKILIQQSKMAQMGEMIGVIAHQWKQPLNALSIIFQTIEFELEAKDRVDRESISTFLNEGKTQIKFMSNTVDDFRSFFKPNKRKSRFDVKQAIEESVSILASQLKKYEIKVEVVGESFKLNGHPNEFKQVILNIVNNAKDALLDRLKRDSNFKPKIKVTLEEQEGVGRVYILDNAGGVDDDILPKIFEPYFSTKDNNGTGIGLYMSKVIIEDSMHGEIQAQNYEDGALFRVDIKID